MMNVLRSIFNSARNTASQYLSSCRDKNLRKTRLKYGERYFVKAKQEHKMALTPAQSQEIKDFWKPYRDVTGLMGWFEFYNSFCTDKSQLKYFIPDSVFFTDIDMFYTDVRRSYELDDKNLYDMYFGDINRPRTVVRKCNGSLMDGDYHAVTIEEAIALCGKAGSVICKPTRNSQGGKGIQFFDLKNGSTDALHERLQGAQDFIVQEVVHQHDTLNSIHDKSVNTIRIMTLYLDNEVRILSSVLRMGRDGARVDNASSGGIFCGINADGTLKECAYDTKGNCWTQHPQGAIFKGLEIAGYKKCCELVKSLAGRFCTTSKLLSWDLAIGEDGEPLVIEVNMTFGQVDFHQICNGPIFGGMTDEVLQQVYKNS